MAVMTPYYHVELNDDGVPMLSGTTMKVIELVQAHLANNWGPDELLEQFPYLTKGQIHSALAYYWDNKDELDRDIEQRRTLAQVIRARMPEPPIMLRLRTLKGK